MTEFFSEFQNLRKILCICPCCADLVRVSDLKLKSKRDVSKTWLDKHQANERKMEKKEEKFGEQEGKLRDIAREKGRKEAQKVFNRAILPSFKALKLDPFDVKPLLSPVDFVVFKGMTMGDSVSDILLLSRHNKYPLITAVHKQIEKAVLHKKYEWQVARIDDSGGIVFE